MVCVAVADYEDVANIPGYVESKNAEFKHLRYPHESAGKVQVDVQPNSVGLQIGRLWIAIVIV